MTRAYKQVTILPVAEGFAIALDGRQALTPLRKPLTAPTQKLADTIAAEWQGQGDKLLRYTMPLTQIACVAIDLVRDERAKVLEDILAYADTDLVCYRAGHLPVLHVRQKEQWDAVIAWAEQRFGIMLAVTEEVMPILQPKENREKLKRTLQGYDEWRLAVIATITKPLGSLIVALALTQGHMNAEQAFTAAHLEESYETGQWGIDAEKEARLQKLKEDIIAAGQFLALLSDAIVKKKAY